MGIHGEAGTGQCELMSCDDIARIMCDVIRDYGREEEEGGEGRRGEEEDGGGGGGGGPVAASSASHDPRDELLVLVNNLGGMSNFEMSLLTRSIVRYLEGDDDDDDDDDGSEGNGGDDREKNGCRVTRVLVGDYMTSFDMRGASCTILPLTGWDDANEALSYLDMPTDAPGWSTVDVWEGGDDDDGGNGGIVDGAIGRPSMREIPEADATTNDEGAMDASSSSSPPPPPRGAVLIEGYPSIVRDVVIKCANALIDAEPILTKYDTIVGDGDCGTTMERGAREILRRLDSGSIRIDHPGSLFSDIADAVSSSMGGTSGILLELFFRRAGTSLLVAKSTDEGGGGESSSSGITSTDVAIAFREGVSAVSFYGGAREGSRTMLDALLPASAAIFAGGGSSSGGTDVPGAASAARAGADATANMELAEAGRSNYLSSDVLFGTPDPGAVAVAVVLEAMAQIIH